MCHKGNAVTCEMKKLQIILVVIPACSVIWLPSDLLQSNCLVKFKLECSQFSNWHSNPNRPYSHSRYWTGTSLQWRLMQGNIIKKSFMSFVFEKITHISLHCKLVPDHYQEYEYGLFKHRHLLLFLFHVNALFSSIKCCQLFVFFFLFSRKSAVSSVRSQLFCLFASCGGDGRHTFSCSF